MRIAAIFHFKTKNIISFGWISPSIIDSLALWIEILILILWKDFIPHSSLPQIYQMIIKWDGY